MRTFLLHLLSCGVLLTVVASCGGSNPAPDAQAPSGSNVSVEYADLDEPSTAEEYVPTLDGPLRILSAAPAGQLQSMPERQAISVTFSRPMVHLGEADPPPSGAISVDPAVPGSLRWEGTQTLFFHPRERLDPATEYTVTLDTSVTDLDGNPLSESYTWSFQTPRLRFVSSEPADGAQFVTPDAVVRLSFDLPVDASAAADYIDASFPIDEVTNDGDSTLVVTPDFFTSFEQGANHEVTLEEGLPSRDYELGLGEERDIDFRIRPELAMTEMDQPGRYGDDRFYPDRGLQLEFSTPVRFGDLRKALSFTPKNELLPGAEARDDNVSTSHTIPTTFDPETRYTLTINDLQDTFGQSISVERAFRTRGFEPHLSMEEGMMVIEAEQNTAIPLQVTNVEGAKVGMESLSADEIIPALSVYDEESDYERNDYPAPDWSPVSPDQEYTFPIERNTLTTIPLKLDDQLDGGTGIVGVRMERPKLHDHYDTDVRALAQVTRLGITGKFSAHENLIFVTELSSGDPVEGATVEIRDDENTVHWQGKTNAEGQVQTPGWHKLGIEKKDDYDNPGQYAIVKHEGDVAFTSNRYDDGIEPYRFDIDYSWSPEPTTETGSIFSDRGLYKTGDSVHVKGILRTRTGPDWEALQDNLRVIISDPRDEIVLDRRLTSSKMGTFDLSWAVPDDAALGRYAVRVGHPDNEDLVAEYSYQRESIASGDFQVNAFRRASFAVEATTSLSDYVAGDFFEGVVSGHYLFGADMAGQPVTYELERDETRYAPPGYAGFQFDPLDSGYLSETLARTETTLDTSSSVKAARIRLPGNEHGSPAELTWRGTVTSPSNQEITDRATATLHPGKYYIGLKPSTSFMDLSQDSTLAVDVVTVDPKGAPVAGKDVTVELVQLQWNSVREVGSDGRLEWHSERTETVVRSKQVTSRPRKISRLRMTVPSGGKYYVRAKSQDVRGNAIRAGTYLYASGGGYTAWRRDEDDQINVIPEKTDYAPGETARLMVQSPYEEVTALITVEREGILTSRVQTLTGSAPMIELPIKDKYLPNVFVSVMLLKGRTAPPKRGSDPGVPSFKMGYASLSVAPDQKHLQVEIDPNKETYRPGEEATVDLQLTNNSGQGVPGEITFSAADAGILNLVDYQLPDPFDRFYGPRPLEVTTSELRGEIIEQRSYGLKARQQSSGGANQKSEARTDFRPLAHWAPALQTDGNGEATVSFELPESLTTFRFMATGVTADHEFGGSATDVVVTKPLVLKKALPRFARLGDDFEAGVLVTNRSDAAGTAEVTASADGLALQGDSVQTVRLAAGATREVRFDWNAPTAGEATLTFRGRLNDNTDAFKTTLPVNRPTTKRVSATFASTQDTARQGLRLPAERVPGLGQFNVRLASTAMTGLDGAVEHLFEYPYGCLEQRTSRIRPLLAGDDLLSLYDLNAFEKGDRDAVVSEWMGSLRKYWTGEGFSLWEDGDHVNEYVTAYVLMALAEAQDAGFSPPQPFTREIANAVGDIVKDRSDRPDYYSEAVWRDTRAFMLYALARHGRILEGEINWLANNPPESVEGQSHLLQTLLIANEPALASTKKTLIQKLQQRIRVEANSAYLEAPDDDSYGWIFSSDVRSTAFGLTALLKATPSNDFQQLAQRMVRYLMDRRRQGHWDSTQDNAAVVTAFQTYVNTYEEEAPDFSASVEMAGKSILENTFQGRSLKTVAKTIPADAFPSGRDLPLSVTADGTGRLYYSMRLTTYTSAPQDARNQGLQVERDLQRLNDQGETVGSPLRTGNKTITLEPGELVKVTVRVSTPTSRPYVVVDDALPAGLEPVNEAFATTNEGVIDQADTGSDRWWGSFTHTEKHDDRVLMFADYLREGEHTYSYVARATTLGTFEHPPAETEMMYEPETRGHNATGTLVVEPPAGGTARR